MEIFIMIFLVTILLDIYMMVNDDLFPYDKVIANRINKTVGIMLGGGATPVRPNPEKYGQRNVCAACILR